MPIRFQPTSFGAKGCQHHDRQQRPGESGIRGRFRNGASARTGPDHREHRHFGHVCIGSFVDEPLTLLNSGPCTLTVTSVASSASEFVVPNVLTYPIRIAPERRWKCPLASNRPASARSQARSGSPATIRPARRAFAVSGDVPSGTLAVTGSTCIRGVKACCLGERTISICNVGDCKLHVTSVAFKRKSKLEIDQQPVPRDTTPRLV